MAHFGDSQIEAVEITANSLKWAYRKLKRIAFYDHSSTRLKYKVVEFEKQDDWENQFEELANKANAVLSEGENQSLASRFPFTIELLPKKDHFSSEGITDLNVFLDAEIGIYLIDILFTIDLLYATEQTDVSFGARFDYNLLLQKQNGENPLENIYLFENHNVTYPAWKNSIFEAADRHAGKNRVILKTDMERCFYNCRINIRQTLEELGLQDRPACKFMRAVYNLYSWQYSRLGNEEKRRNIAILPLGLQSSYKLLDYKFRKVDSDLAGRKETLAYARYVDDILLLLDADAIGLSPYKKTPYDFIGDLGIRDLIKRETGLEINASKTQMWFYRPGVEGNTMKREIAFQLAPSLVDYFISSSDELNVEVQGQELVANGRRAALKVFRNKVYQELWSGRQVSEEFVSELHLMSDQELVNAFPVWGELLRLGLSSPDASSTFEGQISGAIERVKLGNNPLRQELRQQVLNNIEDTMRSCLRRELERCKELASAEKTWMEDPSLSDLYAAVSARTYKIDKHYLPTGISPEQASFFLSIVSALEKQSLDLSRLAEERDQICRAINGCYYPAEPKNTCTKDGPFALSIAALNMDGVDSEGYVPLTPKNTLKYGLYDLMKIIRGSTKHGAQMVLFPELAIPHWHFGRVLAEAKKRRISLVGGISHVDLGFGYLNLTLIYDAKLNLTLSKVKNYFSPKEESLFKSQGKALSRVLPPYYYLINRGDIVYTTMTCFELTSIVDKALLSGYVDLFLCPVLNRDTHYFSSIVTSLSRDASAYVAISNTNVYGDSRIEAPARTENAKIVRLKGGENNFFVIGKLDVTGLRTAPATGNDDFKPIGAGFKRKQAFGPLTVVWAGDHSAPSDNSDDIID